MIDAVFWHPVGRMGVMPTTVNDPLLLIDEEAGIWCKLHRPEPTNQHDKHVGYREGLLVHEYIQLSMYELTPRTRRIESSRAMHAAELV